MEKKISTNFINKGTFIVTENADGIIYTISAENFKDVLDDWNGNCDFVPANDARVFFASLDGVPQNPHNYHDFESFLNMLRKMLDM